MVKDPMRPLLLPLLLAAALAGTGSCRRPAAPRGPAPATPPAPVQPRPLERAAQELAAQVNANPTARLQGPQVKVLPQEEREFLWEVEHHVQLLAKHGYRPLADALARGDAAVLSRLFAADFAGYLLEEPREVSLRSPAAEITRREEARAPAQQLDRERFVAELLRLRALVPSPRVKIDPMALAPRDRDKRDGPWQGSCQLRIWGSAGALAEVVLQMRLLLSRPSKEMGEQGGFLQGATIYKITTGRAPRPFFREVAEERGLDRRHLYDNWQQREKVTVTGGAFLCDYNRDGYLDLLVTDLVRTTFYQGGPAGRFTDVTARVGLLPRPGMRATFADLDGDGWEDLVLDGRFYRNQEGRRFVDVTARSNLPPQLLAGIMTLVPGDYDRDGLPDLYGTRGGTARASSWVGGASAGEIGNVLLHNKGAFRFEDVTEKSGARAAHRSVFTALWLDIDNDLWPDLYVINEFGEGALLVNQRDGTFRERKLVPGPVDFGSMGVVAGDIDNDGNTDVYVANMYSKAGQRVIGNVRPGIYADPVMAEMKRLVGGSQLYHNLGGYRFELEGQAFGVSAVGWAYGPALVDVDNDGWLDLYATAGFMSVDRDSPDN